MKYKELEKYIHTARNDGKADELIEQELLAAGWKKRDVTEHLHTDLEIPKPPTESTPRPPYAPKIEHGITIWDTFENILLFISLYVLAIAIGMILHALVDHWLPGLRNDMYSYQRTAEDYVLRSSIAALLVSSPIYSYLFLRVANRTIQLPELRKTLSRKILNYFTLVVTFVIMLVNVIFTVYSFLNGNVQINSLIHFCITVGISAVIFAYYLNQTKDDRRSINYGE